MRPPRFRRALRGASRPFLVLASAPLIMAITRETVLHVAKLARLELSGDEIDRMQKDLGNILEYVTALSELDTASVAETTQVAVHGTPLRVDVTEPSLANELALREAPRSSGGGFAVPAFVDE
jgi:aspartyl-tRNA(Asn)/glutamyl-tRNA(Gln) amidotransferase subunit C